MTINDNSWRIFHDYKDLKEITIMDTFHIPNIDEILDELHGVHYFTKIDLKLEYHLLWGKYMWIWFKATIDH
jgi:hypothetical protein